MGAAAGHLTCAEAACQAEAGFQVNQTIIAHFDYCIIITCYYSNNGSVITYLYITIMSLLCFNKHVITSLLPVITVIMGHYNLSLL